MSKHSEHTPDEAVEEAFYFVTAGQLADRDGITITQNDDLTSLTITTGGAAFTVPVSPQHRDGNTYLHTWLDPVLTHPALAKALNGRYVAGKRKTISVHELVAIIGRHARLGAAAVGRVGVHHLNGQPCDNRVENLRVLRTGTHNQVHRWLDNRTEDERASYNDSLDESVDGLGLGLPEELRAAMEADIAELEEFDPAEQSEEDGASTRDDELDDDAGPGDWRSDEEGARDPGNDLTGEPEIEPYRDAVEDGEEPYYPDVEPVSATTDSAETDPGRPTYTPEAIQVLAGELGEPDSADLSSSLGMRLKMNQVAERIGCRAVSVLLQHGHPTLTVSAIREEFEERRGDKYAFDHGYLYLYNRRKGVYELANDDFERKVVGLAEQVADEIRHIRLVAGAWPIKVASKVLKALPKGKGATAIVQECRASLYRHWQTGEPMNGDQWTLNVANGLLNLRTQELRPHTPEHLSSLQLPFAFDRNAKCAAWLDYLAAAVPDQATRDVLQEWAGYCLIPTTEFEKALFLFGSGGTGKSTFIKTQRKLVGEGNCAAVALEDLGDKFRAGGLRDKLINVVTEVNPARALNDSRFKAYVSGDPVTGEKKFEDPGVFTPFARFIVAANTLPKIMDQTDAFYRRVIMVHFNQRFVDVPNPDAEPSELPKDPDLARKLDAEMPGILNWALAGLARLLARGRFDIPASLQANVLAFREDQDNALRFLHDGCVFATDFQVSATDLYRAYVVWCKAHGEKPHANNRFGQVVTHYSGVQARKNGSKGRYYKGLRPADADSVGVLASGGQGGAPVAQATGVPTLEEARRRKLMA